ncbi:MAG: amino acid adenylation domain-containing protein, partial [Pseudomonadota bacterium]
VISYFSGNKEFLITFTLFNRYSIHSEVNQLWGDFTSTNLFHYVDLGQELIETLKRTTEVMWEDIDHALYTGLEAQRELSKLHNLDMYKAVSPIIFTGFISSKGQKYDTVRFLDKSEHIDKRYWCAQTSQAWIDLQAVEVGDKFMSKWLYVDQLFDEDYIKMLNQLYCNLIEYVATYDLDKLKLNFFMLLPTKYQQLVKEANNFIQEISEDTLFSRYENIAKQGKFDGNIALIDTGTGKQYKYDQLIEETGVFAKYLSKEKSRGRLIGVLSEKGYNQVISTISIMKSGHGYLPLNTGWPVDRLNEVLRQGEVDILLISKDQYNKLQEGLSKKYRLVVIEDVLAKIRSDQKYKDSLCEIKLPNVKPDAIAYVIFTSGSTGKPKGVTISHRSALNTIDAINKKFKVNAKDSVFALSELSFDLSVYDIFGLLCVGGRIIFPNQEETKDPKHWLYLIGKYEITMWNTVPQLAGLLIDEADEVDMLSSIRLFLLSGDWIPLSLPNKIKDCCKDVIVMSLGGATEGSIWSIWYEIKEVKREWKTIPYGIAMPNQQMYILNHRQEHCPIDVEGEIYIGGEGVALNYWQDAELTRRKFINHPELGRLYATGDLGRWHRDGYIVFAGRRDFQVKIRGYRVELEEIAAILVAHKNISQAVVLIKEDGEKKYLVGYYVSDTKISEQILIQYLKNKFPEYMIPSYFVHLTKFPLTANGKLDRRTLPDIGVQIFVKKILPRNDLETCVAKLWSEILNLDVTKISIKDDFFSLGGDSIASIQLVSKIRNALRVKININNIFDCKTLENLCEYIKILENASHEFTIKSEQGQLQGEFGLLPIQEWFFENKFKYKNHWNQSFMIKVPCLDIQKFERSVQQLIAQHDAFRIKFGSKGQQKYTPCIPYEMNLLDISILNVREGTRLFTKKLQQLLTDLQSGFDIEKGPTYKIVYIKGYKDNTARIYIACHHLIMDAVSWRIIAEDLKNLYEGKDLDAKGSSYRQWVDIIRLYAKNNSQEKQIWDSILSDFNTKKAYKDLNIIDKVHTQSFKLDTNY